MSNILAVRIPSGNRLHFFRSDPYVVSLGDHVLVQVEGELHMGKVERITPMPAPPQGGSSPETSEVVFSHISATTTAIAAADGVAVAATSITTSVLATIQRHSAQVLQPGADIAADMPEPILSEELHVAEDMSTSCDEVLVSAPLENVSAIFRPATEEDLIRDRENRELARKAHDYCRQCIQERGLDMKLVDVEVLFDGSKIVFYFTAPNRIDFRELVKDLVRSYRTRIELRQIGARHETQMLGGLGNCGQLVCCQRFLRHFAPSTIKMAKEQNLFLNPAKISGVCNRLLCCLSYEQPNYDEFLNQCPKIGKRYPTALGSAKVIRANYFRRTLSIFMEPGGEKEIDLDEWKRLTSVPRDPEQSQKIESSGQAKGGAKSGSAADGSAGDSAAKSPPKPSTKSSSKPPSKPSAKPSAKPSGKPTTKLSGNSPDEDSTVREQSGNKPASDGQRSKRSRKSSRGAAHPEAAGAAEAGKSKRRSRSARRKSKKQPSTSADNG